MAPTLSDKATLATSLFHHILARALSSISLRSTSEIEKPPSLASVFATILRGTSSVSRRALKSALLTSRQPIPSTFDSPSHPIFLSPPNSHLDKRQQPVLAIPTTYAGLNAGPAPGALVGIVLGAIAGFLLILYVVLSALRLSGYTRETVEVEEIHHHRHSHSHSRTRSRMTEVRQREERIVVEERLEPESVIVDEEPEDVVEVIEEHSPERPIRKESRRSGFRTVDPAEFGGGRAPMRRVSRR